MSQGAERERARAEEDKRKEQVLFAQLVVSQSSDDLSKTAIIFVSLYICDLIIVVLRKFHRFWRLWKNLKRGRNIMFRDEAQFCLENVDGRVRVWRLHGEPFVDYCIK